MNNKWLLDWEDPESRVETFFLEFERNIDRLLFESRTDGEALFTYYRSFRGTITSEILNSSDSKFDCNSWGDSEVDSWPGDDSVGDFHAKDKRAEGLDHAGEFLLKALLKTFLT